MVEDKTLKLDWKRSLQGEWWANTAEVDGWMIVVSESVISISAPGSRVWSAFRTKKDRFDALLEAEAFARMHVLKRFGALLT